MKPVRALALMWLLAVSVAAQGQSTGPYDLAACVRQGLERNPTLRQRSLEVGLAREDVVRSMGVYDAALTLDGRYEDSELPGIVNPVAGGSRTFLGGAEISRILPRGTRIGLGADINRFEFPQSQFGLSEIDNTVVALSLSQPLLRNAWGTQNRWRVDASEAAYQSARLNYLYERDRLAARIYEAYWSANAALKSYEVNENALARSRELLRINRDKFEDGLLEETDILAAEASLANREVDVLSARDAMGRSQDILLELIAAPVETWDQTVIQFFDQPPSMSGDEAPDMLSAFATAREKRPDLDALDELREQAENNVKISRQEIRPDLVVSGSYGLGESDTRLQDTLGFEDEVWTVGLQLESSWSRREEKAALRQARLRLEQIDYEYEALERAVLLECRLAARNLRTSAERVTAAQRAREIEARKLELEQEKLVQGRTTTRFIIDYQDDLEFAELTYVDALARYQKDLAQYRLVQGTLLEIIGIEDPVMGHAEHSR